MLTQTDREKIFKLRGDGRTANEIAKELGVSVATINYHVSKSKKGKGGRPTKASIRTEKEADRRSDSVKYLEMQNQILKDIISDLTKLH
jgi:IS30 family transposase